MGNIIWLALAWTGISTWIMWLVAAVFGVIHRKNVVNMWRLVKTIIIRPPVKRRRGHTQPSAYQQRLMNSMRK
jgi:hypothetical protein